MKQLGFMLGRPLAPLYSLAMAGRARCYQRGIFASQSMSVPVISVGNLLMGGTGKTPLVQYLARLLQKNGWKPAIISRGYGGRAKGPVNIVADGQHILLDAVQAGDEPRFLAGTLPGVPVLTGVVRYLPAKEAVAMGADVLILDDGFQHLAVQRDVNLVLFNADRLAGNSRVFPGGDLREPISALNRATAFVLTAVDEKNQQRAERFASLLNDKFPGRPVYLASYVADSFLALGADGATESVTMEDTRQRLDGTAFAFCGIAGPDSFFRTLAALPLSLAGSHAFGDHHAYTSRHIQQLCDKAQACGATALITTEKDMVKMHRLGAGLPLPVYALRMRVELEETFAPSLLQAIARAASTRV